jgi:hypothetical protein
MCFKGHFVVFDPEKSLIVRNLITKLISVQIWSGIKLCLARVIGYFATALGRTRLT